MNVNSVFQDYFKRLGTLTSASKPLITSLTLGAQALSSSGSSVVRAIEEKIQEVEPSLKLPLLYLIDSIVKNHGGFYVEGFSTNIYHTFIDSYVRVPPEIRDKFERVLSTWIAGDIFPRPVLDRISNDIHEIKIKDSTPSRSNSQVHVNPKFVPKPDSALMAESAQPGDKRGQNFHDSPEMHRSYPRNAPSRPPNGFDRRGSGFSPPHRKIHHPGPQNFGPSRPHGFNSGSGFFSGPNHSKPRNFINPRPEFPPFRNNARPPRRHFERPPFYAHNQSPQFEQGPRPFPNQSHRPHFNSGHKYPPSPYASDPRPPPFPNHNFMNPEQNRSPHSGHIEQIRPHPPVMMSNPDLLPRGFHSQSMPGPSDLPSNLDPNLLRSLLDSGVLNLAASGPVPSTISGPPQTVHAPIIDLNPKPLVAPTSFNVSSLTALGSPARVQSIEPTSTPASQIIVSLTQKDINTRREGAIKGLYDDLALQCRQCGLRYPSGADSQAKLDSHMDWHFRQNRKKKERATSKRFQSRSWFSIDEDWVQKVETEFDYQNEPAFFNKVAKPQTEIAQVIAKLEKSTVVVPPEHMGTACPICQDKFTSCWSDEEEEWIYKNAVMVDGQICHATCHADHRLLISKASDSPQSELSNKDVDAFKKKPFPELSGSNLMV